MSPQFFIVHLWLLYYLQYIACFHDFIQYIVGYCIFDGTLLVTVFVFSTIHCLLVCCFYRTFVVTVFLQYIAFYYVFYSVTVNVYSIFLITVFLPTVTFTVVA